MHLVDDFVGNIKDGIKNGAADFVGSTEAVLGVVNKNPEKMRALLNLMLTPQFKPTFIKNEPSAEVDFELLGPAPEETPSIPSRMFDVDTGNMVDSLDNDDVNQYCILSHSWKGAEVDLAYVNEAREHNRKNELGAKNDVDMIANLSRHKIEEKKETIEGLLKASGGDRSNYDAGQILDEHIRVKLAKKNLKNARKALNDANAKLIYVKQEAGAFKKLAREMANTISIDACHGQHGTKQPPQTDEGEKDPEAERVKAAEKAVAKAEAELDKRTEESEKVKPEAEFFNDAAQTPLREAVDGLNEALYKWKSAIKIDQSVRRAREVFDEKLFPAKEGGKRYLWNDTCCIDKKDQGELVDSLSLMGDWYANADFCLVHLDTPPSDDEWNDEWTRFSQSAGAEAVLPKANIEKYEGIREGKPTWSTRGWTLQELVLSKTTFYVNSAWERLDRPQERLGHYYFLCPFIELYTGCEPPAEAERKRLRKVWRDTVQKHKLEVSKTAADGDKKEDSNGDDEADDDDTRINAGQHLIAILEAFELNIPRTIDKETAIPLINQAVYIVTTGLRSQETDEDSRKFRLYLSLKKQISPSEDRGPISEDDLGKTIKFLLRCLVAETKHAIVKDREYIAEFGKVEPLKSWMGGTARTRFSTERVMSLACSRTTTVATDRAYSLMGLLGVRFPTFKAEGLPKALARLFDETLMASNDVSVFNWTGREMGSHIRGRSLYPSRLEAFDAGRLEGQAVANKELARLLQTKRTEVMRTFRRICEMLQRTIGFLKKYDHHKHLPMSWIVGIIQLIYAADFDDLDPQVGDLESILKWIQNKCGKAWANKGDRKAPHLLGDRLSGLGDSAADLAKQPMKGLLGGLHKKRSISGMFDSSRSSKRVKTENGSPASPSPSSPDTLVEPYDEPTLKKAVERLSEYVNPYLKQSMDSLGKDDSAPISRLPKEVLDELTHDEQPDQTKENGKRKSRREASYNMVSPNPIIVNNSGIEGVFDIQRVVITFHEEKRLWDQVAKAVSPRQRITGWCSISTGFARVMVSFACEAHILEQQLKIAQVVQRKVVDPPAPHAHGSHADLFRKDIGLDGKEKPTEYRDAAQQAEADDGKHRAQHTEDERRVSRMIAFVQEEPLEAIAGEWVLARFSDVEGANWFLCSLALGSTHGFCGHRVPTDRIDFADAIPEPGLVNVWQAYMNRKKRKLCYILGDYLQSRAMCSAKDIIFNHGEDGMEGDGQDGSGNPLRDVLDVGVTAVRNAGQLTMLSLREVWHDVKADILDGHLTAAVLKYTPKDLQPAVENLNADQDFLPAAFRSGTRIHMF